MGIISSLQEAGPKLATTWRSVVNPASNIQPGRESTKMGIKCIVGSGHICVFFSWVPFQVGKRKESKRSTTICCQNLQASLHFFLPTHRRLIKLPREISKRSRWPAKSCITSDKGRSVLVRDEVALIEPATRTCDPPICQESRIKPNLQARVTHEPVEDRGPTLDGIRIIGAAAHLQVLQ